MGRCLGLEMSFLIAVEKDVTCECDPGSAAHALSLLFCFPKRLSIVGLLAWLEVVWGHLCPLSIASPVIARCPPTQSHHWRSPETTRDHVLPMLCASTWRFALLKAQLVMESTCHRHDAHEGVGRTLHQHPRWHRALSSCLGGSLGRSSVPFSARGLKPPENQRSLPYDLVFGRQLTQRENLSPQ